MHRSVVNQSNLTKSGGAMSGTYGKSAKEIGIASNISTSKCFTAT